MTPEVVPLDAIDGETLAPIVRRILRSEAAEVTTWDQRPLGHVAVWQNTGGLYRFSGKARLHGTEQAWSAVLKVVRLSTGSAAPFAADLEPDAPSYWKREPELFRDGILDGIAGDFIPPRCYGVAEPDEATAWIWLEDIVETGAADWSLARYGLAARHLGQFNGRYLVGEPIPAHRSFCPSWVRTNLALARARGLVLPPPAVWEEPAVRAAFPPAVAERFARNWADQDLFLDVLDRLPRTFCHRDAFRNNLMARRTAEGREQTVAIDWALAGPGHLGEDLFKFVSITLLFLRTDSRPREFAEVAFENYVAGLRDAGWSDDLRLARLGYAATVVAPPAGTIRLLREPAVLAFQVSMTGKPPDEVRSRSIERAYYLLDLADEARRLMRDLDMARSEA